MTLDEIFAMTFPDADNTYVEAIIKRIEFSIFFQFLCTRARKEINSFAARATA